MEFSEKRLIFDIQPDDIPESEKLQTVALDVILNSTSVLRNMDEYEITIFSSEKSGALRSVFKVIVYLVLS